MAHNLREKLNLCRYFIIAISILTGLILWLQKPAIVQIHLNPVRNGNKLMMLPILLLPLLSLIPRPISSKFHVDDDESRLAMEKEKTDNALIQLVTSVMWAVLVVLIMVIA